MHMPEQVSPYAGKHLKASMLVDVPRLVTAYFARKPDPSLRVAHRPASTP
jgi:phosphoglucomutase